MGQTTVGAFTCVGGRALFKKVATRTDGANLLRIAHKGSVTKLAALFALAGGRDKGADVVNSSPKLNVIGQGEGSVHYLDVGGRYFALQGLAKTKHPFSRHNVVNGQKGSSRDSGGDIRNDCLDGGGKGLLRDKGDGFIVKLFKGGKDSKIFYIIYCDRNRLAYFTFNVVCEVGVLTVKGD